METVPSEQFLNWAAGVGISFDSSHSASRDLSHARFWVLPNDPAAWPYFVGSLLDGLDDWAQGFLWPRSGSWPAQTTIHEEGVRDIVLRGVGIPAGWPGAIQFSRNEEREILAVLFVFLVFGWCVDDDFFFVPDHGRQLLQTDHHDVVHVSCGDETRILEMVRHMESKGYSLPTEPPDATFYWPSWMPPPASPTV